MDHLAASHRGLRLVNDEDRKGIRGGVVRERALEIVQVGTHQPVSSEVRDRITVQGAGR